MESAATAPRPNLFLVGASKAGTTSLHHYLGQHPQIFMSPVKEPHFLADEVRPENFAEEMRRKIESREPRLREYLRGPVCEDFSGGPITHWDDYLKLFLCSRGQPVIGESSPCYLWSKTAARNIAARFPNAKIAIVLRNPVERAFAQHAHMLMFAKAPLSFRQHIQAAVQSRDTKISELYPFLEFGLYSEQVRRYLALFPAGRIRISLYEEFVNDPRLFLQGLFAFLGVDADFNADRTERHMQAMVPRSYLLNHALRRTGLGTAARSILPPRFRTAVERRMYRQPGSSAMTPADRRWLADFYREDVRNLSALLDRDLAGWLKPPADSSSVSTRIADTPGSSQHPEWRETQPPPNH